ncbi:hypothetical protein ES702_05092 [subsurface metagenome]
MAVLGFSQKPIVMPHYPHMLPEDRRIWTVFLESEVVEITEVWYDVHVGQGVLLPVGASALEQRIRDGITRKRIDVVCHVGDKYWVVEVKPRANMYALGQILTYVRLFSSEFAMVDEVVPVVICDEVDEDLLYLIEEFGVMVWRMVGPAV